LLLFSNSEDCEIDLLKYDSIKEEVSIERIFPCVRGGDLEKVIAFAIVNECVIEVFENNHVTIFPAQEDILTPIEFTIPAVTQINSL